MARSRRCTDLSPNRFSGLAGHWPQTGNASGHQWAKPQAVYGQNPMALDRRDLRPLSDSLGEGFMGTFAASRVPSRGELGDVGVLGHEGRVASGEFGEIWTTYALHRTFDSRCGAQSQANDAQIEAWVEARNYLRRRQEEE